MTSLLDSVQAAAGEPAALTAPLTVVSVVLILVATYLLIRALTLAAHALSTRLRQHRPLLLQLIPLMRLAVWLLSAYLIVAAVLQPSRESLLVVLGAAAIGIGLAAQDVLKNIFGGILIVLDRPFQVGDLVDIGDHHGEVIGIGLRATRIRTRDDAIIVVPNGVVVSRPVRNANVGALDCMVVAELFLPGRVDPAVVQKLCHEAAASSPYLYPGKPIRIRVADEFRQTFLTKVKIKAYVYDHRLETAFATDVVQRAKRAFLHAGLLSPDATEGVHAAEAATPLAPAPTPGGGASPTDRVEAS